MHVIDTRADFEAWLSSQAWLEDAYLDELVPLPAQGDGSPPDVVRFVFRMQIGGGLVAGETRRMRALSVEATGISSFDLVDGGFSPGNCCQGAELENDGVAPVSFTIDVPAPLSIACQRLRVSACDWDETVPPWFSEQEFFAVVRGAPLPKPEQWIAIFEQAHLRVAWRCYGGPATHPDRVPPDYEGWFVQHVDRIGASETGLFFFTARAQGPDFRISVSNKADDGGVLWRTCAAYVGSLDDAEVHCGNVVLNASAWLEHLKTQSSRS